MKFATAAVHAGQEPDATTGAVIPPIYATSTFAQIQPGQTRGYDYTRSGNPNFTRLEACLSKLENAQHATVFSSGMAAITAVISTFKQGDIVLAEENVYGCTYRIYDKVFKQFGIRVVYADLTDPANWDLIDDPELLAAQLSEDSEQASNPHHSSQPHPQTPPQTPAAIWIESPTNPLLKILDIKAIAQRTQQAGLPLIVDNTFASPYFQKPLDLGATVCLSSTTKYINGHSDCLGGVVCTNDVQWQDKMIFAQKAIGLNPSPQDCWLIQRGVKTLPLRMRQHAENALGLTEFLLTDPAFKPHVDQVRYPLHPSHPQYALAKQQMTGGSGIVIAGFTLSLQQTIHFVSSLKLFSLAESLGGIESLICHPASMTHASIPQNEREKVGITDGLVRFSVGIEDLDDLIADLKQAIALAIN